MINENNPEIAMKLKNEIYQLSSGLETILYHISKEEYHPNYPEMS